MHAHMFLIKFCNTFGVYLAGREDTVRIHTGQQGGLVGCGDHS